MDYCLTGSMAVLDVTARYREGHAPVQVPAGHGPTSSGSRRSPPSAGPFPTDQSDRLALSELLDKFHLLGVETYRAERPFQAGGRTLPSGTVVVPTSQPFGGMVKTLLERQDYPDLRTKTHLWQGVPRRVEVEGGPLRPYDVAGWTLPSQMGLEAVELGAPGSQLSLSRIGGTDAGLSALPDPPARGTVLLHPSDGASWKAVNALLQRGVSVERERGGTRRFVIGPEGVEDLLDVVDSMGVWPASDVMAQPMPPSEALGVPRVGLYRPWQGNSDEGWLRWILEHYGFPYTTLRNDRVREGDLNREFDAILLPSMGTRAILEGNREGQVPPEYAGGIGEEGLKALRSFVRDGGTLFLHEGASALALDSFDIPVADVSSEARDGGFYSAGSVLRLDWNPSDLLTAGLDPHGVAFIASRVMLFEITPGAASNASGAAGELVASPVREAAPTALGSFPSEGDLLLSGYLEGGGQLAGKAAAVEVPYGSGRLVLVGFSLHNRAQTVADFKLLFNAISGASG